VPDAGQHLSRPGQAVLEPESNGLIIEIGGQPRYGEVAHVDIAEASVFAEQIKHDPTAGNTSLRRFWRD